MDNNNPIKYSDLIQKDNSLDELIRLLKEAEKAYKDLISGVRKDASVMVESFQKFTGATAEGRKAIADNTVSVEHLHESYKKIRDDLTDVQSKLNKTKQAKKEYNQVVKLSIQASESEQGSYNQLTAMYGLNKIALNKMSVAQRENTKEGKALVSETNAIYQEMKRLQEVTGKHVLSVGDYEKANVRLTSQIRQNTYELARMRMAGEENTEQYKKLIADTATLKDAYTDAAQSIKNAASDTYQLDVALSGISAVGGGFSAAIGAMKTFGGANENLAEAQKKLQGAIAITTGLTAIQNQFQRQSAIMLGITSFQANLAAKAEAIRAAAVESGTAATIKATIAQKAYNLVAKANPYVLLAVALVTVVGALVAFSKGTKEATDAADKYQSKVNDMRFATKEARDEHDNFVKSIREVQLEIDVLTGKISQYESDLISLADAQAEALAEINQNLIESLRDVDKKYDTLFKRLKISFSNFVKGIGAVSLKEIEDQRLKEREDAEISSEERRERIRELYRNRELRAQLKHDKEIQKLQKSHHDALEKERQAYEEKRLKEIQSSTIELRQEQIKAIEDDTERQITELKYQSQLRIDAIRERVKNEAELSQTEKDLIAEIQKNAGIAELKIRQDAADKLIQLQDDNELKLLESVQRGIELRLAVVRKGSDEEIMLRIEALENQRKIELAQNRRLAEELKQDEAAINAKYDKMILTQRSEFEQELAMRLFYIKQDLAQSEFDLLRNSEREKTSFRLNAEKERWNKILEINEAAAEKMSEDEIKIIKNTIAKINQEIARAKVPHDIYDLFGLRLDNEQKAAITESTQFAIGQVMEFLDVKIRAADAAVNAANKEIDAAQKRLDAEIEARNNGYAYNVTQAQKELDLARKTQEKALKDQEKARKAESAIQSLQQATNLITATAKIWSTFTGMGPAGPFLAIAATALMWGSFAAAKIKAAQVTKSESYGDGTVELLQGGSHASGNDIDLGTKKDGTRRKAEGGEFFAVINKRNSQKYRRLVPDVIKALNNGSFERKYMNAYDTGGLSINVNNESQDLRALKDDVSEIRKQNERRYSRNADGTITMKYKNLTRIYV